MNKIPNSEQSYEWNKQIALCIVKSMLMLCQEIMKKKKDRREGKADGFKIPSSYFPIIIPNSGQIDFQPGCQK